MLNQFKLKKSFLQTRKKYIEEKLYKMRDDNFTNYRNKPKKLNNSLSHKKIHAF